jgi:hypothetical protein
VLEEPLAVEEVAEPDSDSDPELAVEEGRVEAEVVALVVDASRVVSLPHCWSRIVSQAYCCSLFPSLVMGSKVALMHASCQYRHIWPGTDCS